MKHHVSDEGFLLAGGGTGGTGTTHNKFCFNI